jgi:hypothetical protein
MESLKKLEELYLPDVRYRDRGKRDIATGEITEMGVETIHSQVENVRLNGNVPEPVRSHFETAKNLILYSWFVYSFNAVAAMQAFASLEMAVRTKTGVGVKGNFKDLLEKVFQGRELTTGLRLSTVIAKLRNDRAHGSSAVSGHEIAYLRACAELINELYP